MTAFLPIYSYCGEEAPLSTRCLNHFVFLTKNKIGFYEANMLEKTGNLLLWPSVKLPKKLWNICRDPRVLTILLGALKLLTRSYSHLPKQLNVKVVQDLGFIPEASVNRTRTYFWRVFLFYAVAASCRALGRASNNMLMEGFYDSVSPLVGFELVEITE